MTKMILLLCVFSLIISCDEQKKEVDQSETTETNTAGATTDKVKVNPAHGLPGHRCDLPVGAPLNQATQLKTQSMQKTSTTVSPIRLDQTPDINPPHGEPGHDCSVPVGAKLED